MRAAWSTALALLELIPLCFLVVGFAVVGAELAPSLSCWAWVCFFVVGRCACIDTPADDARERPTIDDGAARAQRRKEGDLPDRRSSCNSSGHFHGPERARPGLRRAVDKPSCTNAARK